MTAIGNGQRHPGTTSAASARAPLVSIAIPAYNAASTIDEAIESVLDQTYPEIEVIVVDDGSTDDTPARLAAYGDRIRIVRQPNSGLAAARQRGMACAAGRFIAWFDADDWCQPTMVEQRVAVLQSRPDVVAVSTGFEAFDASGPRPDVTLGSYYGHLEHAEGGLASFYPDSNRIDPGSGPAGEPVEFRVGHLYPKLLLGNIVHPPTLMVRREIVERCGAPDSSLVGGPDYDYLLRIARQGPMAVIPAPLLRYRLSPGQRSAVANLTTIHQGIIQIMEKALREDPALSVEHADLVTMRMRFIYGQAVESFAEADKAQALSYLLRALRYRSLPSPRALAKLALPTLATRVVRSVRASR